MSVKVLMQYRHELQRAAVQLRLKHAEFTIQMKITDKKAYHATIFSLLDKPLVFANGMSLSFLEEIQVLDTKVTKLKYSYHVQSDQGFYFRYDKDPQRARYPDHALCHLHDNADAPRFITHETHFQEMIHFIQMNQP